MLAASTKQALQAAKLVDALNHIIGAIHDHPRLVKRSQKLIFALYVHSHVDVRWIESKVRIGKC